MLVNLFA